MLPKTFSFFVRRKGCVYIYIYIIIIIIIITIIIIIILIILITQANNVQTRETFPPADFFQLKAGPSCSRTSPAAACPNSTNFCSNRASLHTIWRPRVLVGSPIRSARKWPFPNVFYIIKSLIAELQLSKFNFRCFSTFFQNSFLFRLERFYCFKRKKHQFDASEKEVWFENVPKWLLARSV